MGARPVFELGGFTRSWNGPFFLPAKETLTEGIVPSNCPIIHCGMKLAYNATCCGRPAAVCLIKGPPGDTLIVA